MLIGVVGKYFPYSDMSDCYHTLIWQYKSKYEKFTIDENMCLVFPEKNKELEALSNYFSGYIQRISAFNLPIDKNTRIEFEFDRLEGLGEEGYKLLVSSAGIQISANTSKGFLWFAIPYTDLNGNTDQ